MHEGTYDCVECKRECKGTVDYVELRFPLETLN